MISTRGLGVRFGSHWALAHVDLELPPRGRLLLAGANGSGKTTLLRLIAGLRRPTSGELLVAGREPFDERPATRRHLSLVSHHDYLYDRLTAMETLRLWSELIGRKPAPGGEDLDDLLGEVGLEAAADRPIAVFSAGMRKRLLLARARIEAPELLLLDEPFAALDPEGQALVEQWIERFCTGGGTLVVASHALERASRLCRQAVLLEAGQIVWRGAAADLDRAWRHRLSR